MSFFKGLILFLTLTSFSFLSNQIASASSNTKSKDIKVKLTTNKGDITVKLFKNKAPEGVKNFLQYVKDGYYSGLIFHRVISGFMIQGGGFDENMQEKKTRKPIPNEATNGLKNKKGTLAYARTNVINSATSQFFINLNDNNFLNHTGKTPQNFGYAVFGEVIKGMSVVNTIAKTQTGVKKGHRDVPTSAIKIIKAEVIK